MATFYQTESTENYQVHHYAHHIDSKCGDAIRTFKSVLRSYALFHFCFIALLSLECIAMITFFCVAAISSVFAISLASFFLTFFSYLVIHYYFQGKKYDQFQEIKNHFLQECNKIFSFHCETEEKHLSLASSSFQLATYLGQKQLYGSTLPPLKLFENLIQKMGFLLHYKDIMFMQELLMHSSIKEHIELIKLSPVDLAVHTSLANAFTTLAKIFEKSPHCPIESPYLLKRIYQKQAMQDKFSSATQKAIEELKILDDLAPNDPWVHAELASCYHHLNLFEKELLEYEILFNLRPKDKEILYRLGLLYFRLGKNAKGLSIYQALQKIDAKDAAHLIAHYSGIET